MESKDDELKAELDSNTSEIESLKAQVQQLLQLIQQQEYAYNDAIGQHKSVVK